jgi:hypothetical protein
MLHFSLLSFVRRIAFALVLDDQQAPVREFGHEVRIEISVRQGQPKAATLQVADPMAEPSGLEMPEIAEAQALLQSLA